MKIAVLIPARGGSKRIPRKNIKRLNGIPLVSYAIEAGKQSCAHEVWVSSEDFYIGFLAKTYKAKVLKRPIELAQDTSTTELVIKHFFSKVKCDVLIILEPTHPLINSKDIDYALCKFLTSDYDSLITLSKKNLLIWETKNGLAKPIDFELNNRPRMQDYKGTFAESGMWITTRKAFQKSNSRVSGKIGYYVLDHRDVDIDDPIDLEIAEVMLNARTYTV